MDLRSRWLKCFGIAVVLFAMLASAGLSGPSVYAQSQGPGIALAQGDTLRLAQYYSYPYPQARSNERRAPQRAGRNCAFPWTYSRGLQRCICVREGYGLSQGRCTKLAEKCPGNANWSDAEQRCLCQQGYVEKRGQCVEADAGAVTYAPSDGSRCLWPRVQVEEGGCACAAGYQDENGRCVTREGAPAPVERRRAGKNELLTRDVVTVQKCLMEAGYLRAPARSRMDKPSWTAFWFFKQDHSVGRTVKGIYDVGAQHKLFTLCPAMSRTLQLVSPLSEQPVQGPAPGAPQPAVPADSPDQPRQETPVEKKTQTGQEPLQTSALPEPAEPAAAAAPKKRVYAKPEAGCLPGDLHELVVSTYGARPELKRCKEICIARPANFTKKEVEEYETKRGIHWCRSCIEIGSRLPLEDILSIERGADVQVCSRPPTRIDRHASNGARASGAYTKVRALYQPFPSGGRQDEAIAVVIGNGGYGKGLPANESARAGAGAFYTFLTEHLGYRQESIIDLRDATLEDMTRTFGTDEEPEGDLSRLLQERAAARVVIYYAGHAGTRADLGGSYLLSVDAVKYREERSGYPMSRLYANLEKMGAKSILLLLETGFGRDLSDFVYPPNLPEMQVNALPAKPVPGLTVITASDGDQKTLDDPKYGIGLFTRYLIEALAGRADLGPIGNDDGRIDAVELYAYTSHMVRMAARKSFGLLQKPLMSRSGNLRVSAVQAGR